VAIAAACVTLVPHREAGSWKRFARDANHEALVSMRVLAHGPRADLWLAYVGPQTGHDQAQACPSKHPDGYREVPF
jgi:hypothetical protein